MLTQTLVRFSPGGAKYMCMLVSYCVPSCSISRSDLHQPQRCSALSVSHRNHRRWALFLFLGGTWWNCWIMFPFSKHSPNQKSSQPAEPNRLTHCARPDLLSRLRSEWAHKRTTCFAAVSHGRTLPEKEKSKCPKHIIRNMFTIHLRLNHFTAGLSIKGFAHERLVMIANVLSIQMKMDMRSSVPWVITWIFVYSTFYVVGPLYSAEHPVPFVWFCRITWRHKVELGGVAKALFGCFLVC